MKTFFLSLILFLLTVHLLNDAFPWGSPPPKPIPTPAPETHELPTPISSGPHKVVIVSLKGFSPKQDVRFRKIASNVEKIRNDSEFKSQIEGWYFKGKNRFHDTSDTPKQVFSKINSKDWTLEYRLESMDKGVVGYTYPNVSWIAISKKLFDDLEDYEIAGNICHEYGGHKLGRYDHSFNYNKDRPYSVPYGIQWICEDIYKKRKY